MSPFDETIVLNPKPADRTDRIVARLNERWRVVYDPLQWILQVRKGQARTRATGWTSRRFHRQRTALIRSVHELCGDVAPAAMARIEALTYRHSSCGRSSD